MFAVLTDQPITCDQHFERLRSLSHGAGAIVTFTGLVRDFDQNGHIDALELEHYPGMTEESMNRLIETTRERFDLSAVGLIHRIGRIEGNQIIVWVGTAAPHRKAAFEGAQFLMDNLKQSVLLWKKEWRASQSQWVEAKESDKTAFQQWLPCNADKS